MHVDYKEMLVREPKIEYKTSEANIENRKVNIQLEKVNIGMFGEKISGISKEKQYSIWNNCVIPLIKMKYLEEAGLKR